MYFQIELTHRCGVLIPEGSRKREDWLFGRVGLANPASSTAASRCWSCIRRARTARPYAWVFKPEFIALTGAR